MNISLLKLRASLQGVFMEKELISYQEAALFLGLPIGTLYSLVSQKRIPHKRFGNRLVRFSKTELGDWIQVNSVQIKKNNDSGCAPTEENEHG